MPFSAIWPMAPIRNQRAWRVRSCKTPTVSWRQPRARLLPQSQLAALVGLALVGLLTGCAASSGSGALSATFSSGAATGGCVYRSFVLPKDNPNPRGAKFC
jgi:hypothetical protein